MIIASDADHKEVGGGEIIVNRAEVRDDPPPAYINPDSQIRVPSSSDAPLSAPITLSTPVPGSIGPTNFLSMSRGNGAMTGIYVVDPRPTIPHFMLPPLAADETDEPDRTCFCTLATAPSMSMSSSLGDATRSTGWAKSSNGTVKLHADAVRPPIWLTAQSSNCFVTIHVPRSLRGPLDIRICAIYAPFTLPVAASTCMIGGACRERSRYISSRCSSESVPNSGKPNDDQSGVRSNARARQHRLTRESSGPAPTPWVRRNPSQILIFLSKSLPGRGVSVRGGMLPLWATRFPGLPAPG
ncbi:hypothetical protein C8R43DRAFT_660568 [Mycena crocata]|nr:hypothetical protein C8R43DRAFT_660568 [Mycena crocata]